MNNMYSEICKSQAGERDSFEKWMWIELIGFDHEKDDFRVRSFLENAGFVPEAISLLMFTPDFTHTHQDMSQERVFPPDYCSYRARPRSEERERQAWTNYQLKGLIDELHKYGIEVYCSFFSSYEYIINGEIIPGEWSIRHIELNEVTGTGERIPCINALKRFNDGTYYEDFFVRQLIKVLSDYNFDGFHAADGYTSPRLALSESDYSDDMVNQFITYKGVKLTEDISMSCDGNQKAMEMRADWIWKNSRLEWIDFHVNRWESFWSKIVSALHEKGKKVVLNTAWTRDPFEALYRYGINYRCIADTGIDAFVVEAGSTALCIGGEFAEFNPYYDFMAMLMSIKACVPHIKLIHLNAVHDTYEQWDAMRHAPTALERDIYSFANLYWYDCDGRLKHCSSGPVFCLSDSIKQEEWKWLKEKWDLGFSFDPESMIGITAVWSEQALGNQLKYYSENRNWTTHRIISKLLEKGAPIHSVANISCLDKVRGAILVTNPHLMPDNELKEVLAYKNGPIVMIGVKTSVALEPQIQFEDIYPANQFFCAVYGEKKFNDIKIETKGKSKELASDDLDGIVDPKSWLQELYYREVSDEFLENCVEIILDCTNSPIVLTETEKIKVTTIEKEKDKICLFILNDSYYYATPELNMRRNISAIRILTQFPGTPIFPMDSKFSVKIPGKGMVVLEIDVEMDSKRDT